MKKYIAILLIFAACSTANEPEPPAFESYRIGSWEVFAEKQAKWVGTQMAAKAEGDSTHFTEPSDGFALYVEARKYAHLFPEDENHFQLAIHDSTMTEEPDWESLPGDVPYLVETPFTEAYRGFLKGEDFMGLEMGYIYDCEEPYELEGDEVITFWNVFSGEERTVSFDVDGYMDTIHAISCD